MKEIIQKTTSLADDVTQLTEDLQGYIFTISMEWDDAEAWKE
jgi:hypothetical protein